MVCMALVDMGGACMEQELEYTEQTDMGLALTIRKEVNYEDIG